MLNHIKHLGTDIYIYTQESNQKPRLLQHGKIAPLSWIRDDLGNKPAAVINASYFSTDFAIGRNQGDLRNDTYNDKYNGQYCDIVFTNDGKYHVGKFNSWDYTENVVAGISLATFLILDGKNIEATSPFGEGKQMQRRPQTAIGVLSDGTILLIVSEGDGNGDRGINGYELRDFIRETYPNIEFLGQCDGGGSSEMIVDGKIVNRLSERRERSMWNGFALLQNDEPKPEIKPQKATLIFQDYQGTKLMSKISQGEFEGNHIYQNANDFNGRGANDRVDLLAPFDCVVKAFATYDNTAFFESLGPVIFADGTVHEHAWFMAAHTMDSDVKTLGLKVGAIFKQGQPCYTEGSKGLGSGYHMHIEQGPGVFNGTTSPYYKTDKVITIGSSSYPLYLPCSSEPECAVATMMFLDKDIDYSTCNGADTRYNWVYLQDEPEPDPCEDKIKELESKIQDLEELNKLYLDKINCLESINLKLENNIDELYNEINSMIDELEKHRK